MYQSLCQFTKDLLEQIPKVDTAEASVAQASHQLEVFDKELEDSMKAKTTASLKLVAGEAIVQDMASEIFIAEQRLLDLKEKKDKLDKAVVKV